MKATKPRAGQLKAARTSKPKLKRERYGGEPYEYYSLGKHVVSAPGVCGGRPTFKYTRLEVSMVLSLIAAGETLENVVREYSLSRLTPAAVQDAIRLADQALLRSTQTLHIQLAA